MTASAAPAAARADHGADGELVEDPAILPFGPYRGEHVEAVAVIDPAYLADLVREGVGPVALRAEAARALAQRGRLETFASRGGFGPLGHPAVVTPSPSPDAARPRPWIVAGLVAAAAVAWLSARGGAGPYAASGSSVAGMAAGAPAAGQAAPPAVARAAGFTPTSPAREAQVDGNAAAVVPIAAADGEPGAGGPSAGTAPSAGAAHSSAPAPCGARVEGAIPAETAADFVDTFQAVEFQVVRTKDTGKVTFLNSRDPYQGSFYVAVFPTIYADFPAPPAQHFKGRCIVVQGPIELYRGDPQIVLRSADDVRVVDGPPEGPVRQPAPGRPTP